MLPTKNREGPYTFTVTNTKNETPKTGDSTDSGLLTILGVTGLISTWAGAFILRRKARAAR